LRVFGQPERLTTCDCERSMEPNMSQALYLMNDTDLLGPTGLLDRKDGRLAELSRKAADLGKAAEREKSGSRGDQKKPKNSADQIKQAEQRIKQLKDEGKEDEAANLQRKLAGIRQESNEAEEKVKAEAEPEKPKAPQAAALNADELVREMYLRTLSRFPTDEEMSKNREYLASSKDTIAGVRDVLWALLNTKEFIVNH
jgi:hypothetical protein